MKKPPSRITRRQLAAAILTTAAVAQTPPSTPATPDAELQAAREQNQRTAEALAKVQTPIAAEPAFHFTA
ncbi:MAG: hypothetical protein ABSF64_06990 [Bryobacteraceae bacterium]|jgi:hypothetical protein